MDLPPKIDPVSAVDPVVDLGTAYRSPRTYSKLLAGAFVLRIAALVVTGLIFLDLLDLVQAARAGQDVAAEDAASVVQRAEHIDYFSKAFFVLCVVMFCQWVYRMARNASALRGSRPVLSFAPGWAVGWFFIPLMNLWRPYTVMAEIWDASRPDNHDDPYAPPSHGLLLTWWLLWLAWNFVSGLLLRAGEPTDVESLVAQLYFGLASLFIEAVVIAFAMAVVWKLTRRQEDRAAALLPPARIA